MKINFRRDSRVLETRLHVAHETQQGSPKAPPGDIAGLQVEILRAGNSLSTGRNLHWGSTHTRNSVVFVEAVGAALRKPHRPV